jgi:hypothetical protein
MLREIWGWAVEGRKHDIPWCCGLRFGIDCERPKPLRRVHPRFWSRLNRITSPRGAFALWDGQGYVPCEYHLLKWLLGGDWPTIKQDDPEECRVPPPTSQAPSD